MTKSTQRRRQQRATTKPTASTAQTAASANAKSARIVPFAPRELLNVRSSKELVLVMGDIIAGASPERCVPSRPHAHPTHATLATLATPASTAVRLAAALRVPCLAEYHKYHERTGLVHGNISPQNVMRIPLEPGEPDRYGLRVKGVLLDLDYSPVFRVRQTKDGGQDHAKA